MKKVFIVLFLLIGTLSVSYASDEILLNATVDNKTLTFNTSELPENASITEATLNLTGSDTSNGVELFEIRILADSQIAGSLSSDDWQNNSEAENLIELDASKLNIINNQITLQITSSLEGSEYLAEILPNSATLSVSCEQGKLRTTTTRAATYPNSPIPDTGITNCYNDSTEIPCSTEGQDYYGQDGNYSINPMSYTKLDSSGNPLPVTITSWAMVRDNVTGLIWENKNNKNGTADYSNPQDADNTYTWYDSNPATNGGTAGTDTNGTDTEDFIKALNDSKFGGYSDWRIPTITELTSIINYGIYDPGPAVDTLYFRDTPSNWYWTNITYSNETPKAWLVYFRNGDTNANNKGYKNYVRAVRGGTTSSDSLVINNDGIVTDTQTGLMWQKSPTGNYLNWKNALGYCEKLELGGYKDWRLPNVKELRTILYYNRYNPSVDTTIFSDTLPSDYWSSSTPVNGDRSKWYISFSNGDDGNQYSWYEKYVRAVRGGQAVASNLILSVSPTSKNITTAAGTTIFAVSNTGTGTMAWSAAVTSGTWLTITSGNSGSNTGTITCSYTVNTTTSARTAVIKVTATGANGSPVDVKVTQASGSSTTPPTLALSSSSGASGTTATVNLTLTNVTGTNVAAISTDIDFDSSILENPTAVIGAAGTAAGKDTLTVDMVDSNTVRIALFSLSNTTAIGNGVAAFISFDIKSSAANGSSSTLTQTASGSDQSGNPVAVNGTQGKITVSNCKLGDCNCNGSVTIDEVQSAINMLLGLKTVQPCCDRDGNGSVSIAEVQSIINNFRGIAVAASSREALTRQADFTRESALTPILTLESKSATAGDTIKLTLTLENQGAEITSLSTYIIYDTNLFESASAEIGEASTDAGKTIFSNDAGGRLVVGLISMTNSNIINDGVVGYITLKSKADASGIASINNIASGSDENGTTLEITGNTAQIAFDGSGQEQSYEVLTPQSLDVTIYNGESVKVVGCAGVNTVNLSAGGKAECVNFIGANVINIEDSSSGFTVRRSGATVYLEDSADGTLIKIPASKTAQSINFTDDNFELVINNDGKVMLGAKELALTESQL